MSDEFSRRVTADGVDYVLVPQPIRTSLTDDPAAMWGFQVHVMRDDELVGIKTCFVGRIRVHTIAPHVVDGPTSDLAPIVYGVALDKIVERLAEGAPEDEILFA